MEQSEGLYSLSTTVFESISILNASKAFASLPVVGKRDRGITGVRHQEENAVRMVG